MDQEKFVKLSIIIPTIGRRSELDLLLASIVKAGFSFTFEILVIDQNPNGYLQDIINGFKNFLPIHHHVVPFKGLSRAKNYGVDHAKGHFLSFPDDDCMVFTDTYTVAFDILEKTKAVMTFGKCIDDKGNDSVLNFQKEPFFLTSKKMLGGFVEATVITERKVLMHFKFDENMGAGTFFGAEEGFDWVHRILTESAYTAYYTPKILFYHPQVIMAKGDLPSLNRVFKYRCGTAYLCVKHQFWRTYYQRLVLVQAAALLYWFTDRNFARYYRTETYALQIGKVFAKKTLKGG